MSPPGSLLGAERPGRVLPLYPMTVADVLDGAFRVWRNVVGPAALAVLLVTGPVELLSNLVLAQRNADLLATSAIGEPTSVSAATVGLILLFGLIGVVATVYASATVVGLVLDADCGRRPQVARALRNALRPTGTALVVHLLLAVAAVAAMIGVVIVALVPFVGLLVLLAVGPIALGAGTAFAALVVPIAVVEGSGPVATLSRAWWVLRVRFWRTVGITLLLLLVLMGVSFGLSALLQAVAVATGPFAWLVMAVSAVLLSVVQVPVLANAALLIYLDARMLREGYDLDLRLVQLSAA